MNKDINFSYEDIRISRSGDFLSIENSTLKRTFDLSEGIPRTLAIHDKKAGVDVARENPVGDFSFIGMNMPWENAETSYQIDSIELAERAADIFDGERVELDIIIRDAVQQLVFRRKYIIYPGLPVLAVKTSVRTMTSPNIYWQRRADYNENVSASRLESRMDSVFPVDGMVPIKTVEFTGRTDYSNEQVSENAITGNCLKGNLLFCRNGSGAGLFILHEAPPTAERRDWEKYDFRLEDAVINSCGWGIEPQDPGEMELWGYRHVIGCFYDDGSNGTSLLKKYLKTRFPFDIEKNASVMVNPWGCGCFPELLSEKFLKHEIEAAGELHATHYQIDDGWQQGKALNQLSLHNRCAGTDFWLINKELLPEGFGPIISFARTCGVEPALWVAPSANRHYRDWKEFADQIYDYHKEYGFNIFKVDFVKIRTKEAEDNLEKMLRYLREKSNGKIYFNLDTTNGQRPGYFMFLEYGNIFLENRYVCHDWGVGYHPEETLNNLWNLAKYLRPQLLQIEIPDPGIINYDFYEKRGSSSPDAYACDYWAAVAMFANPLLWLAPSRLSNEVKVKYREVVDLYLKYYKEIFSGEIYPVGSEPDGKSITGFQSHNQNTDSGFFILYCEKNAPLKAKIDLLFINPDTNYECCELFPHKEMSVNILSGTQINAEFSQPGSWKMFKYHASCKN